MTWARLDGVSARSQGSSCRAVGVRSLVVVSLVSGGQLTDGLCPRVGNLVLANIGRAWQMGPLPSSWRRGSSRWGCSIVGLFRSVPRLQNSCYLQHNPSARQMKAEQRANRRSRLSIATNIEGRDPERDGDRCCTAPGRSTGRAAYDWLRSTGSTEPRLHEGNTVVACASCNQAKGKKTLARQGCACNA